MFDRILNRLAGDYNARKLKALAPLVKNINDWYHDFDALSDTQIQAKTQEFKDRIAAGASLDDLLPEAFAIVKQASKRLAGSSIEVKGSQLVRDMVPYDSQLIG
jgi:preprotein translocase subunit SecA